MQPELQKLKQKYGDVGKDLEKQKQYQKEMSELMKSGGWNPLAGCWPLFIQMPIFSALYYAISRTEEIRTSSFLWVNLGHADTLSYITDYRSINDIYSDESFPI